MTLFDGHAQALDDLLKQADIAMYQAKTSGRNAIRFYDPVMQAAIAARSSLERDLRATLEHEQFMLCYQAQVSEHGRVVGAEVLIRWNHPARGMVPPMDFIPLAEETGLILPIGQWVLKTACEQLKIDQSFVRNIGVKSTDAIIIQTIIGLAGKLEMEVIAEGVETSAQRAFLLEHGCTVYQGYLLGRPVPLAQFEQAVV